MGLFQRAPDPTEDPDPERFRKLMIDGEPDFDDLIACVFGITEPVAEVYLQLLDEPDETAKDLSDALDCDQSTVNRKLDALRERGLVTRKRDLLSGGGVTYRYEAVPLDQTRERMHDTLDEWTAFMHEAIDEMTVETDADVEG